MNKKITLLIIGIILCTYALSCQAYTNCGIGIKLFKDHTNNKSFIQEFLPNSPAEERKIPLGSEIISIDKKKTKYLYEDQIYNLLNGQEGTIVSLVTRYNGKKYKYDVRRRCCYEKEIEDAVFDMYWKQIVPINMAYTSPLPENITASVSSRYKKEIVPLYEYWYLRRYNFQSGYNMCKTYYPKDFDNCMKNLIRREVNRTIQDEQVRINRLEYERQKEKEKNK